MENLESKVNILDISDIDYPSPIHIDLIKVFKEGLENSKRPDTGALHCSRDLTSPLRYVQLRAVKAPTLTRPIAQDIRALTGTLWHNWFHEQLKKVDKLLFLYELNLDEFLPDGWTGTADWVLFNPAYDAWLLVDFKTVRGEAISWLPKKGVKEEHRWQLSAYWHALKRKRLPLISTFLVLYWPMNEVFKDPVAPVLLEDKPLPEDQVFGYMQEVHEAVEEYKRELERTGNYLNSKLAPPPPREQKIFFNKRLGIYDVKLVPSWHERFCEFSPALCPRSKVEKIGHFTPDGKYVPRPGFEHIKPTIMFSKGS